MSFQLPNFLHWSALNALRSEMGAPLSTSFKAEVKYVPIELPLIDRLQQAGVDVEFEDITVLDDGTLSYKGYRVLLYIRDISNYGEKQRMPRFHLSYCKTLETMRERKRFERYVVANRDDGVFQVNLMDEQTKPRMERLSVCQNCLSGIDWDGFSALQRGQSREAVVQAFSLTEFFVKYPRDLLAVQPTHTSDTAPLNQYTDDWPDVSEAAKRGANYCCGECRRPFTLRFGKYLHVHHANGLKHDNRPSNLEVLCIGCHAEEAMHGHMKSLPEYMEFKRLEAAGSFL